MEAAAMTRAAIFAYGSLASRESAARTLGRPIEHASAASLTGWRRAWTVARDNLASEKTFTLADGSLPRFCLALNLEPDRDREASGLLIEVSTAELERLELREIRYRRVDVTGSATLADGAAHGFGRVDAFVARPEHHRPTPPPGSVVIADYVRAVEGGFAAWGEAELERFRATTEPLPAGVAVREARLVRDAIPAGNPRSW